SGGSWTGSDAFTRDLMALDTTRDPSAFASAALRTGDRRLSLDAALLDMARGDVEAAARIARSTLTESTFDEAAAYILYDAGSPSDALLRMKAADTVRPERAEASLVLADMAMAAGGTSESESWIRRSLALSPMVSWTAYVDAAGFAADRGDLRAASRLLDDGAAFFPSSRPLLVARAKVAAAAGDTAGAVTILSGLVSRDPADDEAGLFLLSLQTRDMSPEQYRARLWRLFNRAPSSTRVFDALGLSLLAARDWEGAETAVAQHEAAGGAADRDMLLIAGTAAAMRGDDARAVDRFRRAAESVRDGVGRYDLAIVLLRGGKTRAALEELDLARDQVERRGSPRERASMLSRIETLRGSACLVSGDIAAARRALTRARTLDPHNLRAGLLLRKLEAAVQ
ncbi:MAG TPA: hypothetical protein VHE79_04020, partial [Spirochaetia bacterium]